MVNAFWDAMAKEAGLPVWKFVATMTPEQIADIVDYRYLTDALTRDEALGFAITLATGSVMVLGLVANWLAALLLAFTILFYGVIYTLWLKRSTPQNIVIGGAAGALPPLIGQVAMTEHIRLGLHHGVRRQTQPPQQRSIGLRIDAQDVADEAGVQNRRGEGLIQPVHLPQRAFDRFQLHIGEAQAAQDCMIQARRLDQSSAPQQPPLGRGGIAALHRHGARHDRVQPANRLAIGRLPEVQHPKIAAPQAQGRLGVIDEQADAGVAQGRRLLRQQGARPLGGGVR